MKAQCEMYWIVSKRKKEVTNETIPGAMGVA